LEKTPVLKGEPYLIKQVRGAAKYMLEGSEPCFEDIITVYQLESLKRDPSPMPVPTKSETTKLLNSLNMLGQNFQAAFTSIQSLSHLLVPNTLTGSIQQVPARPPNFHTVNNGFSNPNKVQVGQDQ